MPVGEFSTARFPPGHGQGIDAQQAGAGYPAQPPAGTRPDESGFQGVGLWQRVVAEESNEGGEVPDFWFHPAFLPVQHRGFVHPDLGGNLTLEQAQIEPPLPDVVADGYEGGRVARFSGMRR